MWVKRSGDGGRQQILESARHFFAKKGFHQTNMAELAERASVSVGQMYRLFPSKVDIIKAIVREDAGHRLAGVEKIVRAVSAGSLNIGLAFEKLAQIALVQEHAAISFEILAEAFRNTQTADILREIREQLGKLLRDLTLHANPSLQGDRLLAAEELLQAYLSGLGTYSVPNANTPTDKIARLTSDLLLRALQ